MVEDAAMEGTYHYDTYVPYVSPRLDKRNDRLDFILHDD